MPLPSSAENGLLLGSAQTRSSRAFAAVPHASSAIAASLGKAEYIELASRRRHVGQILHRIDEAECARAIALVELARHDRAGPAADTGQHRDILLAVRAFVRRRLADDAGPRLELPQKRACLRIE